MSVPADPDQTQPENDLLDRLLATLEAGIEELRQAFHSSRARPRYVVTDLAVIGFCREVLQQAQATLLLTRSDVPYAAFSSARGALEAAQDLLLVVAKLSEGYALTGARILAADLLVRESMHLEYGEFLRRSSGGEDGEGPSAESQASGETRLRQWGEFWEHNLAGSAELVQQAARETQLRLSRRGRTPHWSGIGRWKIARFLQDHVDSLIGTGEFSDFGDMQYAYYSLLSIMAHPWPRFDTPFLRLVDNRIRIDLTPRDRGDWPRTPAIIASFSTHAATQVSRLLLQNDHEDLIQLSSSQTES